MKRQQKNSTILVLVTEWGISFINLLPLQLESEDKMSELRAFLQLQKAACKYL